MPKKEDRGGSSPEVEAGDFAPLPTEGVRRQLRAELKGCLKRDDLHQYVLLKLAGISIEQAGYFRTSELAERHAVPKDALRVALYRYRKRKEVEVGIDCEDWICLDAPASNDTAVEYRWRETPPVLKIIRDLRRRTEKRK